MPSKKLKVSHILAVITICVLVWPHAAEAQAPTPRRPLTPLPATLGAARHPELARSPAAVSGSPWTSLANQPDFLVNGAADPMLLTDGTVLVQDTGSTDWWRLRPDQTGSYVNGTWTQIASLPTDYAPLYHSSAVLPDGRLIIEGGEYNNFKPIWTAQGAIYDPMANVWTPVAPPPNFAVIEDPQLLRADHRRCARHRVGERQVHAGRLLHDR